MFAACLHAQQPASETTLATVLVYLGEKATELDRSLPSFSCLQTAISEELERPWTLSKSGVFESVTRSLKEIGDRGGDRSQGRRREPGTPF